MRAVHLLFIVAVVTTSAAPPRHLAAQDTSVTVGTVLRVSAFSDRRTVVGAFSRMSRDTLNLSSVATGGQGPGDAAIPVWDIRLVERRAKGTSTVGLGILGVLGGAALGTFIASRMDCTGFDGCLGNAGAGLVGGGLLGLIAGVAIGSASEGWKPMAESWLPSTPLHRGENVRIRTRSDTSMIQGKLALFERDTLGVGLTPLGKPAAVSSRVALSDVATLQRWERRGSHANIGTVVGIVAGMIFGATRDDQCGVDRCSKAGPAVRGALYGLALGRFVGSTFSVMRWVDMPVETLQHTKD